MKSETFIQRLGNEQAKIEDKLHEPYKTGRKFIKSSCYEQICEVISYIVYASLIVFSVLQIISTNTPQDSEDGLGGYMVLMILIPILVFFCNLNRLSMKKIRSILFPIFLFMILIGLGMAFYCLGVNKGISGDNVFLKVVWSLYLFIIPIIFSFQKKSFLKKKGEFKQKEENLRRGQWILRHIKNNPDLQNTKEFLKDARNRLYCKELYEILEENQKDYEYELLEDRIRAQRNSVYFPFFEFIGKKSDTKGRPLRLFLKEERTKRKDEKNKQFDKFISTLVNLNQESIDVSGNYNGKTYFGFFNPKEQKVSLSKGQDISFLLNHDYPNEVEQVKSRTSDGSKDNYITITPSGNDEISYRITRDLPLLCPNLSIIMICGMPINGGTSGSYNETERIDNYKTLN